MGEYWKEVKNRWNNMAEGNWDQVTNFTPESGNQRQHHQHDSEILNQRITLNEGDYRVWSFQLSQTTPLSLSLQRQDGPNITIYILSDREYCNFEQNRQFYPSIKLNYDDYMRFELPYGKHYVVAYMPKMQDGYKDRSVALIRLDELV